jgi:hypothetical protein
VLVNEVAQSLDEPTPQDVEEELAQLGLRTYVREFLPLQRRAAPPFSTPGKNERVLFS